MENGKMEPRMDTKEREEELKLLKEQLKRLEKMAKRLEKMAKQISSWCEQAEEKSFAAETAAADLAGFVGEMKKKLAKTERGVGDGER